MDKKRLSLKGSRSRDEFKAWHKRALDGRLYALDIDLALIAKDPPGIMAVIDYKPSLHSGALEFSEVLAYNDLTERGIPVYLVIGREPFDRLDVYLYVGGNWEPHPPMFTVRPVLRAATAREYERWEQALRGA